MSRLSSTRSTCSGAQRASGTDSSSRSLERDVAGACFGLEAAYARLDERCERDLLELVQERACVDAGELEEIVDEDGETPRLVLQWL